MTQPPVVPSLMSMDSAVVALIVLFRTMLRSLLSGLPPVIVPQFDSFPRTTLRSLLSGWQSVMVHQLDLAVPM